MTDAKVTTFPSPSRPGFLAVEVLTVDGTVLVQCAGAMHYFLDRTKTCQCGENRWPEEDA